MKTVVYFPVIVLWMLTQLASAQNKSRVVTIIDHNNRTEVRVPGVKVEVDEANDTITKITIGPNRFEVIEEHNRSRVRMVRLPIDRFKGHWAGVELGYNGYVNANGSTNLGPDAAFMELNHQKSTTFGINFLQYNIGLQKQKNNLGVVVGAGLTWYNYRTDAPYRFERDPSTGSTIGVPLPNEQSVSKNKITSAFINIPLLLEWQFPASEDTHRFFISAGPYCGFRMWGHSKIVYHESGVRHKSHSSKNININPFQYGMMVRMGYRWLKMYGTYNFSTLYTDGKGPELHPYTVGLMLLSF